jgi:regulator of sigma E protease
MELLGTIWFCSLAALGFGFVIFIHELGHFLFAKWAGVKVERFSIGFGPVILRKNIGETEYAISLLPLGGYVKMLGQEDVPTEGAAETRTDPRSYLAKSPWWQAAILLGGVLFNLISSYAILLGIAWHGKQIAVPIVGAVTAEVSDERGRTEPSPAVRLGLKQGDRILTINGEPVREFEDLQMAVITSSKAPLAMTVERRTAEGGLTTLRLPPEGPGVAPTPDFDQGRLTFGVDPIAGRRIDGVASLAGDPPADSPRPGERLTAIAGVPLPPDISGQQIQDLLMPYAGGTVELGLEGETPRTVSVHYGGPGDLVALAFGFPVRINRLTTGSAAEKAGLKPGDVILAVDGKEVAGTIRFMALTRAAMNADREFSLRVLRGSEELTFTLRGGDLNGQRLVGARIESVSGWLPALPKAFDDQPSPLAIAGLKPGDAIIGQSPLPQTGGKGLPKLELAVVSGGERSVVPLSAEDVLSAKREKRASRLAKLLGMGGEPSLLSQVLGMRVLAIGDGNLKLASRDGVESSVFTQKLSEAGRATLAAGLKPDDWITGLVPLADGGSGFEVMRGAGKTARSLVVEARDPGLLIVLERLEMRTYQLKDWTEAFTIANGAAYTMVVKTLQIIPKFFQSTESGGLDPNKSLSGPIGIFRMLKGTAEQFGFVKYLEFMALIGLNLFLINLLPIPVTDGGQLVFLAIETAIGRPLPVRARNVVMYIGLAMVLTLMLYVVGLDLMRLFGLN